MQPLAERLPAQPQYELHQSYKPYMSEVSVIKIPTQDAEFDWSWLYHSDDVIIKIDCLDGVVVVLRAHRCVGGCGVAE